MIFSHGCKRVKWTWEARPFAADHSTEALYGPADSDVVYCSTPAFSDYTCFDSENIASLVFNIKRLQRALNSSGLKRGEKRKYNEQIHVMLKKLKRDKT